MFDAVLAGQRAAGRRQTRQKGGGTQDPGWSVVSYCDQSTSSQLALAEALLLPALLAVAEERRGDQFLPLKCH